VLDCNSADDLDRRELGGDAMVKVKAKVRFIGWWHPSEWDVLVALALAVWLPVVARILS
jgi:hypothetical protein